MKKAFVLLLFVLFWIGNASSQERYGMCNSIYAGTNGIWMNPATIVHSPFKWDLHFVTVNPYLDNNYLYLYKTNWQNYIGDKEHHKISSNNASNKEKGIHTRYMLNDKLSSDNKILNGNLFIQGPSIMVSFADLMYETHYKSSGLKQSAANAFDMSYTKKWSFAISTAARGAISVSGMDYKTADLFFQGIYSDIVRKTGIEANDFKLNAALWNEISLSLGREVFHNKHYKMKAAVTYKNIRGNTAAFFHNDFFNPYFPNFADARFSKVNSTYGHSISSTGNDWFFKTAGLGHGFDVGLIFVDKLNEDAQKCKSMCDEVKQTYYKWQLGLSFLDIGTIKYNKNAVQYSLTNESAYWPNVWDARFNSYSAFDDSIGYYFYDGSLPQPEKTSFSMGLPTAVSAQFDYNLGSHFFVNATAVQRVPYMAEANLYRANSLAITPRFDYKRFGAALPIIFYNYMYPRFGLAIRLNNNIIVGTDRLGSFLGSKQYGADVYFSLKLNLLRKCHYYKQPSLKKRMKKVSNSEQPTKSFIKSKTQSNSQSAASKSDDRNVRAKSESKSAASKSVRKSRSGSKSASASVSTKYGSASASASVKVSTSSKGTIKMKKKSRPARGERNTAVRKHKKPLTW